MYYWVWDSHKLGQYSPKLKLLNSFQCGTSDSQNFTETYCGGEIYTVCW